TTSCLLSVAVRTCLFFFFQAEDGIRDWSVTGVQTCALPISHRALRLRVLVPLQVEERVLLGLLAQLRPAARVVPRDERHVRDARSEERRVGKECRSRWSADR